MYASKIIWQTSLKSRLSGSYGKFVHQKFAEIIEPHFAWVQYLPQASFDLGLGISNVNYQFIIVNGFVNILHFIKIEIRPSNSNVLAGPMLEI